MPQVRSITLLRSFPELEEGETETHWLREPDLLRKEALQVAQCKWTSLCREVVCRDRSWGLNLSQCNSQSFWPDETTGQMSSPARKALQSAPTGGVANLG